MKKIVLLIAIAFLVSILGAFAEGIDVSSMTTEELTALRQEIDDELNSRAAEEKAFGAWVDDGVGVLAPDPVIVLNRPIERSSSVYFHQDDLFFETVDNVTDEEFQAYREALKVYGFANVLRESSAGFEATKDTGESVSILFAGGKMNVTVRK